MYYIKKTIKKQGWSSKKTAIITVFLYTLKLFKANNPKD